MKRWPTMPLGKLVQPTEQRDPREKPTEEFYYVDIASIDNEGKAIVAAKRIAGIDAPSRARKVIRKGDIIVSTVRPNLNAVACVPAAFDNQICSTGFSVLRPSEKVLSDYLFAFVRSPEFISFLVSKTTGANYPAVSDSEVKNAPIPLPTLVEQGRIVKLISEADDLRDLRNQADRRTAQLIPALFNEMFGNPVRNQFGWKTCELGDVISAAQDGPHVSPRYSETGVAFLSTRHIKPGRVIWEDLKFVDDKEAGAQWKKCKPERGDVLYTKGGTTGIAAAVTFDRPFAVWVHVAVLKSKHGLVEPVWLESMLNSEFCYAQSQKLTHGIANRDLGLTRMVKIKMFLPPFSLQRHFSGYVSQIRSLEEQQAASRVRLNNLVKSALHNAFSSNS